MDGISENGNHSVETVIADTKLKEDDDVDASLSSAVNDTAGSVLNSNIVSKICLNTSVDSGIHDVCIKQEKVDTAYTTTDPKQTCDHSANSDITLEQVKNAKTANQSVHCNNESKGDESVNEVTIDNNTSELQIITENDKPTTSNHMNNSGLAANGAVNENGTADPMLMEYRSKDNIMTVDDTSDSSPDSTDSEDDSEDITENVHETTETQINKILSEQREETQDQERKVKLNRHGFEDLRTKGELLPEDLPPLEELTITVDESVVMVEVGSVMSIVGILVVIKSNEGVPPLNDDTILFMEGHKVIGQIFEVFGPVKTPWYSVRFNEADNIASKGLSVGMPVYYAPREDSFTKLVFVDNLRDLKGSDASWEDNNEPPEKHLDYSDDEAERKAKAKRRNKTGDTNNGIDENGEDNEDVGNKGLKTRKRRARRKGNNNSGQVDNSWNPFKGSNSSSYSASASPRSFQSWPPTQAAFNRPRFDNTTNMNHQRFGQMAPIGGLTQHSFVAQSNTNNAWIGGSQNNGSFNIRQSGNRIRIPGNPSMFAAQNQSGQVGFDVTRPPPPFIDNSLRPANIQQNFSQNLQQQQLQQQMNVQFRAVNASVPQSNNLLTGMQVSDHLHVNQSVLQNNSSGVQPYQQNSVLNQSSVGNQTMVNNNMPGPFMNHFPGQIAPPSIPNINGPVPAAVLNPARLPNSVLQGQHGITSGNNTANMAANMMTQQVLQNGGLAPMRNQTNPPGSNLPFQGQIGLHDLQTVNSQHQISNQNYNNAASFVSQQRFPLQMNNGGVSVGNQGNAIFPPNNMHSGTNMGMNLQTGTVDQRLIQNNSNM